MHGFGLINTPERLSSPRVVSFNVLEDNLDKPLETPNIDIKQSELSEAPSDMEQIDQIVTCLEGMSGLQFENWTELSIYERVSILQEAEDTIAEIEHRPSCHIDFLPLEEGVWGGYNPATKDITINSDYAGLSDFETYRDIIDTLVHEGRHAYQDYNVNVCEIHPRHSEVESWSETMSGGKWEYWGDCSTMLGQRLYEQQSIEIDARNFASDVLEKLNLNV